MIKFYRPDENAPNAVVSYYGKGSLVAWDPVPQKQVWKVQHEHLWNGGTLATAGGVVFQGTADGFFNAYDAADGERPAPGLRVVR